MNKLFFILLNCCLVSITFAQTPWMLYYEPVKDSLYRFTIRDVQHDSVVSQCEVQLPDRLSRYNFFGNQGVIARTEKWEHLLVSFKNKSVTKMTDSYTYNMFFVFNQDVWAYLQNDSVKVGIPNDTLRIDLNGFLAYRSLSSGDTYLEWVVHDGTSIYVGIRLGEKKDPKARLLLQSKGDNWTLNEIDFGEVDIGVMTWCKPRLSPGRCQIGMIYIDNDSSTLQLRALQLETNKLELVANHVSFFDWMSPDSLVFYHFHRNLQKRLFEVYDQRTQKRTVLFEYKDTDEPQNLFYHDNALYFKHHSRTLEIFTNMKFMKYDFDTGEIAQVLVPKKHHSSFYDGYFWDMKTVEQSSGL